MNVKNRSCIRRLSFRSLKASRKRNLIAIFAIMLTTLLFTSLFTIAMSLNSSYETYTFRQIGGYAHGTFKEVSEKQIAEISGHPKVKAVGERTTLGYLNSGVFAKVPAEVSFMDKNCTKWSYAEPTVGHMPSAEKEITMDTTSLKLLGIDPVLGAEITLTYTMNDKNDFPVTYTDTFTLAGWWEYDEISPVHYINISEMYADAMASWGLANELAPFRTDLNVMMRSSMNIRGQMEQVDRDLGYSFDEAGGENVVRIGVNWGYTSAQLDENIDITTVLPILAFLGLIIFTGYLIIYNIFQISVTGDIRFYGLLKTIGVTPRQLRRIIRQQALFLCVIGIPVGLLLGYITGSVLTPVVMANTTFGASITTISNSPVIFFASALFALVTVLISASRPERIAAKVSPVEATKYTEASIITKKQRATRGAKVSQMAFANLGRNKVKTVLVVISLSLSVVLLNILVTFTNGFDMEKYLSQQTCADFIVSSTDYFRSLSSTSYLTKEDIQTIATHTTSSLSGCGYTISGFSTIGWMDEEHVKRGLQPYVSEQDLANSLSSMEKRGDLLSNNALIEGLDDSLFDKITVLDGSIEPLFDPNSHFIAVEVSVDDYGHVSSPDYYPPIGAKQLVTYVDDAYYIDTRTGEKSTQDTPAEFLKYHLVRSHDVEYTVCAYITVPYSMGHRYSILGYDFVLPVQKLKADSNQTVIPMFYLFDTPDAASEDAAESYLADLTANELPDLMYESKATLRNDFESFRQLFLLIGGLLCFIIGLVGVLNFINAIMTSILSRQREFAILQSIGMTNRQLKQMLVYEGIFFTLGSGVAALLFTLVLNGFIWKMLEKMFWFFSSRQTLLPVLAALPVFALLGWLIPFLMCRQVTKYSIVERIRETE